MVATKPAIRRDHRFRSYIIPQLLLFVNVLNIRLRVGYGGDPYQRGEHLASDGGFNLDGDVDERHRQFYRRAFSFLGYSE